MKIFREIEKLNTEKGTAVALGAFDGLHLGHQAVIAAATGSGYTPAVFTFEEDPSELLEDMAEYLLTREDKHRELEKMGVELLLSVDFKAMRSMEAEEFFEEVLLKACGAKLVACGADFRFGRLARGNVKLLRKLCDEHGIELRVVDTVTVDGLQVSSTAIREALHDGDVALAEKLLGRPFCFTLPVSGGNRIGRTLGTPTVNQVLPLSFIKPLFGVYAAIVHVDGRKHWGVCNIGIKPTVGKYDPLAETWIGEFSGDLYGRELKLELVGFIRPERKFDSLEELKDEIVRNAETARNMAENYLKNRQ